MKCSLSISNFLEEISSFLFCCFPLFLCIDHWGRLSYLSLLFFGTLHSDAYLSFSPLLFASLLFTLFVRPPQTAILIFCISFPQGWSWSLSPVQCHEPHSIVHQALYLYRYDLRTTIIKKYPIHFQILPSLLRLPVLPTLYKYWLTLSNLPFSIAAC